MRRPERRRERLDNVRKCDGEGCGALISFVRLAGPPGPSGKPRAHPVNLERYWLVPAPARPTRQITGDAPAPEWEADADRDVKPPNVLLLLADSGEFIRGAKTTHGAPGARSGRVSHFATCPAAAAFKARRTKQAEPEPPKAKPAKAQAEMFPGARERPAGDPS